MLARNPFLTLFKSLRDEIVASSADIDGSICPPGAPLGDHYYLDARMKVLDAILSASLDLPFRGDRASFLEEAEARASLESPDIAARMDGFGGPTYKDIFDQAIGLVRDARGHEGRWVGFHEHWVIDFFPALARAYPDAKFMCVLRDPRAVVNSFRGIVRIDPMQYVHTLSVARHWRKLVAFVAHLSRDPLFEGRLLAVRYESLVRNPEPAMAAISEFLEIEPSSAQEGGGLTDHATGERWKGNSSFGDTEGDVDPNAVDRWKEMLPPPVVQLTEAIAGPDMRLCGYAPLTDGTWDGEAIAQLLDEDAAYTNWRTDLGDPIMDIGFEMMRDTVLRVDHLRPEMIRRLFLFEDLYEAMRDATARLTFGGERVPAI